MSRFDQYWSDYERDKRRKAQEVLLATLATCETCTDGLDDTSCLTLEDHSCEDRDTCKCGCNKRRGE